MKNEFKGTPNSWKVRNEHLELHKYVNGGANHSLYVLDIQDDLTNRHIVQVKGNEQLKNELVANANLIAAAPDLLGACISLMDYYENKGQLLSFDVDIIRQAINKALNITSNN